MPLIPDERREMAKQQLPSEMKILAGLRLRAARLVLGVQSEKAMAATLGVGSNAYSNYERGERLVDVALAVRLLELTGIGPDWIYGGSTTGVPFDRAQSLQAKLRQLQPVPSPGSAGPERDNPPGPDAEPTPTLKRRAIACVIPVASMRRRSKHQQA